ncbi:nuclear transport factor 2 family protein [Spirosoma sordidisoli]|uniref:Nuclear transport factor 2 family protein n=1 Tax=Spirosoma sordidisoli TaxID=2502893 RepID=A0A4Q2UE26_9BACT|nr:nuclear transport factor 2 family protein [Spirosoma sordidisoli]RYC67106.1 nuclear transport factor 2 family protein [Spirosoma sordidisoli]
MIPFFLALCCLSLGVPGVLAQVTHLSAGVTSRPPAEQELIALSKQKWQWMADKQIDKLALLFDDKAKFVHMSGTWKKDEELDIIKTGSIWYKNAEVHDVAVELFDNTAIVWSRLRLDAIVRGAEVRTEFTATEVYQKQASTWKMTALTFSSVRDTHQIKH